MKKYISYEDVTNVIMKFRNLNEGDRDTQALIDAIGADLISVPAEEMEKILEGDNTPWYTESWTTEDLENALTDADIEITPDRVSTLRKACADLWDDLSDRREQLADLAGSLFKDDTKLNTKIEYLYRDASNWKRWNTVIVKGVITTEQVGVIMDCLHDGEYFIPQQIGLPEVRFETQNEDDHCWFGATCSATSL